jgi:replication factor C large subunit
VNMLYASAVGRDTIDDANIHTSQKDERTSIFSLISALFSKIPDTDLLRLAREVEDTPENIEQWIEGNVHLIEDETACKEAYQSLARADEYLGYTYRRQYYILWRYATAIMLLGVADAAGGRGIHTRIMPPERWKKMASAKKAKVIRQAVLNRLAVMMRMPASTLRENYLGMISLIVEQDPSGWARAMEFDADQLNFFLHDRTKSQEIVRALQKAAKEEEAQLRREQKKERPVPPPQPEPPKEPAEEDTTGERKAPVQSQSTLFDGF